MLRSLCCALLAFVCLFSAGISQEENLWSDIRNPENQAVLQKFYEKMARSTTASPYLLGAPPLLSPGLVASIPVRGPHLGASSDYVDVAASDEIARNVLEFAQNLSRQITSNYRKTTIFSPLSIMSALALLLLGAKGRSYSELLGVFGQTDMVKLHEQFGLMLNDVQQPTKQTTSPLRQLDNWHSDSLKRVSGIIHAIEMPHKKCISPMGCLSSRVTV